MTPQELSSEIRRIASGIENSKNPSRELVAADIKKLLNHLATSGAADAGGSAGAGNSAKEKKVITCRLEGGHWVVTAKRGDVEVEGTAATSMEDAWKNACSKAPWMEKLLPGASAGASE